MRALKERIKQEEENFNFIFLNTAISQAQVLDIREIIAKKIHKINEIETTTKLMDGEVILDIRIEDEQESNPLNLPNVTVQTLPFYKLASQFGNLDQNKFYLLYCEKGVISRLQALYLREQGFYNVKVYRP